MMMVMKDDSENSHSKNILMEFHFQIMQIDFRRSLATYSYKTWVEESVNSVPAKLHCHAVLEHGGLVDELAFNVRLCILAVGSHGDHTLGVGKDTVPGADVWTRQLERLRI